MRLQQSIVASLTLFVVAAGGAGRAQVPPAAAPIQSGPASDTYEVRIEGGDLALSGLHVLKTLAGAKMLPVRGVELTKGEHENVCDVFIEEINLPGGCTIGLVEFARTLNSFKGSPTRLAEGTKVYYPQAEFEKYAYEKQYNLSAPADRIELEDDKRKAGQYMHQQSTMSRSGRFIEHTFDAYKLRVRLPNGKESEDIIRRLNAYPGVFVVKETAPEAPKKPSGYSMAAAADQIPAFCTGNGTPEEPYAKLVGATSLTLRDCATAAAGACAEIVILDQPIAKHPEIDGIEGSTGAQPGTQESLCTDPQVLGVSKFHSTHMAGIIASKQNNMAFIGLHPGGKVVQGWVDEGEIANKVQSRRNRASMQVYLYARSWKLDAPFAKGDRLVKIENRTENLVAKRIHNLQENLWIVAAGQPSPDGLSVTSRIDGDLNLGPMNSGDQENVLVVGGCTDCGSGKAKLWGPGHYSRQFVHVAAPADLIVSTATGGSYTWAQGTSQAAAFVAGVVSALVSDWPNSYKFASRVKERLQYTATPFQDASDRDKIAAGVVNPTLALKDPTKNYADLTDPGKGLEEIAIDGWCETSLTVLTPDGNLVENGHLFTNRIHRIVQAGSGQRRQWSVFADKPWGDPVAGFILHIGPGVPTVLSSDNPVVAARPLLKAGSRIISLQQIEDLLVEVDLPKVTCQ